MKSIQDIDNQILELVDANKQRMEDALKNPDFKNSPEKLTAYMLEYQQTLLQIHALQQERLILLVEQHLNNR